MRIHYWLAVSMLTGALLSAEVQSACDHSDKCAAKLCEIDAAIEAARKEGSMRKVATLKDLRAETLRCVNRKQNDASAAAAADR